MTKITVKRDWTQSWVKMKLDISYNSLPVQKAVKERVLSAIETLMLEAIHIAKANVAPGKGPGPHPHDHVDTGNLRDDIRVTAKPYWKGNKLHASIGCTAQAYYGVFLERGWTAKSGRFYIYPWLAPAVRQARRSISKHYRQRIKGTSMARYSR